MNQEYRKHQIINTIIGEISEVDCGMWSYIHENIISCNLRALAEDFGIEESNKLIRTTRLKDLGWKEAPASTKIKDLSLNFLNSLSSESFIALIIFLKSLNNNGFFAF